MTVEPNLFTLNSDALQILYVAGDPAVYTPSRLEYQDAQQIYEEVFDLDGTARRLPEA